MKHSITTLLLLICSITLGQTSVISVKSHSGELNEVPEAQDKFGEFIPAPTYDTLIKTDNNCVIQIGTSHFGRFRDTVCEHWYYDKHELNEKNMREYYGEDVILIGFDKKAPKINGNDAPFSGWNKQNSSKLIVVILILSGLSSYIFSSKKD